MFKKSWILLFLTRCLLRAHNHCYSLIGRIVPKLEPDGLHPKHRLMNYHQWFVSNIKPDWTVLDIGCGNGALTYDLKKKCRQVIALDTNKKNIEQAKTQHAGKDIQYLFSDAMTFVPDSHVDAVVLSNVLEHIEKRVELLRRLSRFADFFLIRVPAVNRDWLTLYKKEMGLEWRLDPTHYTEYTLDSLRSELESADLCVKEYTVQFGEIYAVAGKRR